ncbi:hypothetical protein RND81_06G201600 [Saponaria officinalis]|uniref:Uncharacterized protein n=1 Tax=Saponaria officinalis TaxID=3572 RepID=A0AAW1K8J0_SAPOF
MKTSLIVLDLLMLLSFVILSGAFARTLLVTTEDLKTSYFLPTNPNKCEFAPLACFLGNRLEVDCNRYCQIKLLKSRAKGICILHRGYPFCCCDASDPYHHPSPPDRYT